MRGKARVQKFRAKLRGEQCGRVEAWIPISLIEGLRTIAQQQNRYLWAVVKDALKAHVARHAVIATISHGK